MGIQKTALESMKARQLAQQTGRNPFQKRREIVIAEQHMYINRRSTKNANCVHCKDNDRCYHSILSKDIKPLWMAATKELNFRKGEHIFSSGTAPEGVFVVCSGKVVIEKQYVNGQSITAHIAGHGEMIGDRAYFARGKYWEDAMAASNSKVAFIDTRAFETVLDLEPHLVRLLLKVRSRELGTAAKKAITIIHEKADNKIVMLLAKRAENLVVKETRTRLANMAGICLETFVRALKKLEEAGMIKRTPFTIVLTPKFVEWYNGKWLSEGQKMEQNKK
jgi:CRP-like cAMP-binding protein